jgi:hypothetical protein
MIIPVLAGGDVGAPLAGDPFSLRRLAAQMAVLAGDLQEAGLELATIDSVTWGGSAAAAFRAVLHQQPGRYVAAGEAYASAAAAVSAYANVLEEAQAATTRAGQLRVAGAEASGRWQARGVTSPKVLAGPDPGWTDQQLAVTIDSTARAALAEVATSAAAALRAAAEEAPHRPGFFRQIAGGWGAEVEGPVNVAIGFAKGAWSSADGVWQMGKLYESETNPFLELIDPASEAHGREELSALDSAVTEHPSAFIETMGKNLVAWDEWSKNSEQAAGQVLPTLLLGAVTDGGSLGARGAGEALDAGAAASKLAEVATRESVSKEFLQLPVEDSWGKPSTLEDHFLRHASDFAATSSEDYAKQAGALLQRGLQGGLPTKIDPKTGIIRIYDPQQDVFGAYNPDGTTRTLYRPDPLVHGYATNWAYWGAQPGYLLGRP